jgi:hypothetical protein
MIRMRAHFKLKSGEGWNDFLRVAKTLNELARKRSGAEATIWTQVVGPFNELVLEYEYPDLATMEQDVNAFYADKEAVAAMAQWRQYRVEGSGYSELWGQAELVG